MATTTITNAQSILLTEAKWYASTSTAYAKFGFPVYAYEKKTAKALVRKGLLKYVNGGYFLA